MADLRADGSGDGLPIRFESLKPLSGAYWWVVAIGAILRFARFSEAFLVLRVPSVGLAVTLLSMVMVVMSVMYAASAFPADIVSDRLGRRSLLTFDGPHDADRFERYRHRCDALYGVQAGAGIPADQEMEID